MNFIDNAFWNFNTQRQDLSKAINVKLVEIIMKPYLPQEVFHRRVGFETRNYLTCFNKKAEYDRVCNNITNICSSTQHFIKTQCAAMSKSWIKWVLALNHLAFQLEKQQLSNSMYTQSECIR